MSLLRIVGRVLKQTGKVAKKAKKVKKVAKKAKKVNPKNVTESGLRKITQDNALKFERKLQEMPKDKSRVIRKEIANWTKKSEREIREAIKKTSNPELKKSLQQVLKRKKEYAGLKNEAVKKVYGGTTK